MKLVAALTTLAASAAANSAATVPHRCHTAGQVAITFDDGPSAYTPSIRTVLDQAGVTGTFHISVGMLETEGMQEHIRALRDHGHLLGLRVDPRLTIETLEAMSFEELKAKLDAESNSIHAVTGIYPRFIRLPYGFNSTHTQLEERVRSLGYIPTLWSVDSYDYQNITHEQMFKATYDDPFRSDYEGGPHTSAIILHNDLVDIAEVVQNGVELLKEKGMRLVNLGECTGVEYVYKSDVEGAGPYLDIERRSQAQVEAEIAAEEEAEAAESGEEYYIDEEEGAVQDDEIYYQEEETEGTRGGNPANFPEVPVSNAPAMVGFWSAALAVIAAMF